MALVNALHGRARVRAASNLRLWLVALLVAALGLRTLDYLAAYTAFAASHDEAPGEGARMIFQLDVYVSLAGPLVAGVIIDRWGLKTGIGLAFLAWCALVVSGAAILDAFDYRILTPLLTYLLPGLLLTAVLVAARLAWPLRRRALVVAILLLAEGFTPTRSVTRYVFLPGADMPEAWQAPMFLTATMGAALFAVWILGFPEIDHATGLDLRPVGRERAAPAPWRAIVTDPGVWSIVAIQFCVAFVTRHSQARPWDVDALREGIGDLLPLVLAIAGPVAFGAAAVISDRVLRQRHSWLAARRPLLVGAFVVTGIVALVGMLAPPQNAPLLSIIDAVGLGVLGIADLLVVDLAPRGYAGRYIGFVLSAELVTGHYAGAWLASLADGRGELLVLAVVAAVGAVITSWLLPRLQAVCADRNVLVPPPVSRETSGGEA